MTMSETENRGNRKQDVQAKRRRREGMGADRNLKLHVPEQAKDQNFHYRFIKSDSGRVQQLTKSDDYDVVQKGDDADIASVSDGTTVERIANKDGARMILVRKPKEFYEADKAEAAKRIDATEESMRRGSPPSTEGLTGADSYVPGGKNIVSGR